MAEGGTAGPRPWGLTGRRGWARSCRRVLVAQSLLDDFSGAGPRPIGADLELLGDLLGHEAGLLAEGDDVMELEVACIVSQLHNGADTFAAIGVAPAQHR